MPSWSAYCLRLTPIPRGWIVLSEIDMRKEAGRMRILAVPTGGG